MRRVHSERNRKGRSANSGTAEHCQEASLEECDRDLNWSRDMGVIIVSMVLCSRGIRRSKIQRICR
jgi:hypothetical protein